MPRCGRACVAVCDMANKEPKQTGSNLVLLYFFLHSRKVTHTYNDFEAGDVEPLTLTSNPALNVLYITNLPAGS